ncbi:MAG: [protein-PII] uridylyltransferase, partial [Gammaproteobacteria bacterium]|nr:[protein-PII] uridylyltransferase [Gammaproteobacteria bacterium]
RLLDGDDELFAQLEAAVSPDVIWDSKAFFAAKYQEQQDRHEKFSFTAHQLEPHVKEAPGGLRDIQTIAWVARRHFGTDSLRDLVDRGFLTEREFEKLLDGLHFLWRVRFALHCQSRRREERLLFDMQLRLAEQFGYSDADHGRAVEQFMQHYYRTVTEISRLNEMLLELFEEDILLEIDEEPEPINARFRVRNGFLETTHDEVFRKDPSGLLELFLLLQQHPEIKGVSPSTIRLVRRDRDLIDEDFRKDKRNRKLFIRILREPQGVTHELRRMNRYGILGRYIPAFGNITGRMQFDLFHAYTVDEHILFVVSNLRRFALPRYDREFPFCSRLMQKQNKPELLYLAGLFHDIAKGRGGDHSELGAVDAEEFCVEHGLSRYDARLVAWLVKHHLLLSVTAQKKDISDPQVILEFAQTVGDQLHLDCLYLLTVADVRGTNPDLWNSWKARLFRDLYEATRKALLRGLENPIDKEELISDTKDEVMRLLALAGRDVRPLTEFWESLNEEYFLRHSAEEISWHATILL